MRIKARRGFTDAEKDFLTETVLKNPYIPHKPFLKQAIFLTRLDRELLYGGQAGGGKSDALLMAALQYVMYPDYHALLLRRTYKELALPGALMDRADEWLTPTDAEWNAENKTWEFPSGATLTFGYLEHERDKRRYQSSEFQFIGFDELTEFTESQYTFLFSRNRKTEDNPVPLRTRAATNPGGVGHDWVKQRFIEGPSPFLPSSYTENPYLDASYEESLDLLDPITRRQLKYGDWSATIEGRLFTEDIIDFYDETPTPEQTSLAVRYWDLAATPDKNDDSISGGADWTVGALLILDNSGSLYLEDIIRFRLSPAEAEDMILRTIREDFEVYREKYMARAELEGGASARYVMESLRRRLAGVNFDGAPVQGKSKLDRARALLPAFRSGQLRLKRDAQWLYTFTRELLAFPSRGVHDDQVDALSGAYLQVADMTSGDPYGASGRRYKGYGVTY